jgi:hypothetical protein
MASGKTIQEQKKNRSAEMTELLFFEFENELHGGVPGSRIEKPSKIQFFGATAFVVVFLQDL